MHSSGMAFHVPICHKAVCITAIFQKTNHLDMKKLILGFGIAFFATQLNAQVQPGSPQATPGATQSRPMTPGTTTSPGTNNMNNNGTNPANGTYPGATYPGTTNPYPGTNNTYPGTNTTTQPGINTPGTGTAPRPGNTTTTPNRTYSDRNNMINNNPNPQMGTTPTPGMTPQR